MRMGTGFEIHYSASSCAPIQASVGLGVPVLHPMTLDVDEAFRRVDQGPSLRSRLSLRLR